MTCLLKQSARNFVTMTGSRGIRFDFAFALSALSTSMSSSLFRAVAGGGALTQSQQVSRTHLRSFDYLLNVSF
jgi:hypothetical protein